MTAGVALSLCVFCGHPSSIRAGGLRGQSIGSRAPPPRARTCARGCTRAHRCTYAAILTRAQQAMHNHAGTCARGTLQELHTRSRACTQARTHARTHAPFSVLRCAVPPVSVPAVALGSLGAPCCRLESLARSTRQRAARRNTNRSWDSMTSRRCSRRRAWATLRPPGSTGRCRRQCGTRAPSLLAAARFPLRVTAAAWVGGQVLRRG